MPVTLPSGEQGAHEGRPYAHTNLVGAPLRDADLVGATLVVAHHWRITSKREGSQSRIAKVGWG
jgi:hypothetical protein